MIQELIYTSVPRGLAAGAKGFCVVAATRNMPAHLSRLLESLSGYRPVPGSGAQPVAWSHVEAELGGQSYRILSRVADYGLDYSQRTNKLAHHIALSGESLPVAGPAWVLRQSGLMESTWEGEPRLLAGRSLPNGSLAPGLCRTWQAVAGDAGWAGVLAQTVLDGHDAWIIVPESSDVLALAMEATALLPPERRWEATFTTYFLSHPPTVRCRWKFVIAGSPEVGKVRRSATIIPLDLTRGDTAPDTPASRAARAGAAIVALRPAASSTFDALPKDSPPTLERKVRSTAAVAPSDLGEFDKDDELRVGPPQLPTRRRRAATTELPPVAPPKPPGRPKSRSTVLIASLALLLTVAVILPIAWNRSFNKQVTENLAIDQQNPSGEAAGPESMKADSDRDSSISSRIKRLRDQMEQDGELKANADLSVFVEKAESITRELDRLSQESPGGNDISLFASDFREWMTSRVSNVNEIGMSLIQGGDLPECDDIRPRITELDVARRAINLLLRFSPESGAELTETQKQLASEIVRLERLEVRKNWTVVYRVLRPDGQEEGAVSTTVNGLCLSEAIRLAQTEMVASPDGQIGPSNLVLNDDCINVTFASDDGAPELVMNGNEVQFFRTVNASVRGKPDGCVNDLTLTGQPMLADSLGLAFADGSLAATVSLGSSGSSAEVPHEVVVPLFPVDYWPRFCRDVCGLDETASTLTSSVLQVLFSEDYQVRVGSGDVSLSVKKESHSGTTTQNFVFDENRDSRWIKHVPLLDVDGAASSLTGATVGSEAQPSNGLQVAPGQSGVQALSPQAEAASYRINIPKADEQERNLIRGDILAWAVGQWIDECRVLDDKFASELERLELKIRDASVIVGGTGYTQEQIQKSLREIEDAKIKSEQVRQSRRELVDRVRDTLEFVVGPFVAAESFKVVEIAIEEDAGVEFGNVLSEASRLRDHLDSKGIGAIFPRRLLLSGTAPRAWSYEVQVFRDIK